MFPDYMNDMLGQARCGHCNAPQTLADIQIVGVRRPEEFEAFYGEPVFIMVMGCKECGQWTNHTMRRPSGDAIYGIVRFIELIKKECQGKKPPLNIPGLGKKSKAARRNCQMVRDVPPTLQTILARARASVKTSRIRRRPGAKFNISSSACGKPRSNATAKASRTG